MGFTLLQTWITNYCADTVEWCPVAPYLNYFICGTYQLQESMSEASTEKTLQSRVGQIHLFSVTEHLQLCLHCTIDCSSGVLDCKWFPRRILDKMLFVTANADGKVVLWTMETGKNR
jgi:diphthamide biosynthesis protein 7